MTEAQIKALLEHLNVHHYNIYLVAKLVREGIQQTKILALEAQDIQGTTITVRGGKADKTVTIPAELAEELAMYIRVEQIESGLVFLTSQGKPLDTSWFRMLFAEIGEKIGFDGRLSPKMLKPIN